MLSFYHRMYTQQQFSTGCTFAAPPFYDDKNPLYIYRKRPFTMVLQWHSIAIKRPPFLFVVRLKVFKLQTNTKKLC